MVLEMKIPSPGESITEVEISQWLVSEGDIVSKDQTIAELDSDKATLDLPAEAAGKISLKAEEGDTISVGEVVCIIDTSFASEENLDKTIEDKSITSKTDREKLYGQDDHVRKYGIDYKNRLESVGFVVDIVEPNKILSETEIKKFGILIKEEIYTVIK